ncbi:MAG: hypothetical protein WAV16_03380 [Candidatus Moraniibacteriota bacterium]
MTKRNILASLVAVFVFSSGLVLAGCANKSAVKNEEKNQNQVEEQVQLSEKKDENEKPSTGEGKMNGGPSAEMTAACSGKAEGDSCEVILPSRDGDNQETKTILGSCKKRGESEALACTPNNLPEGGAKRGMSPAAE